jgi:methylated-DNA-[protein]-cysteine S-methyltransferase
MHTILDATQSTGRINRPISADRTFVSKTIGTPIGKLTLAGSSVGLAAVLWEHERAGRVRLNVVAEDPSHPILLQAQRELGEYFAGGRKTFDVPLDFVGTAFQIKVWHALLTIPFGETRSYGEIARQIAHPDAQRAVGAANGRNPIAIFAPCHRVIGANGHLTGFAGGLEAKAFLLALEGSQSDLLPLPAG